MENTEVRNARYAIGLLFLISCGAAGSRWYYNKPYYDLPYCAMLSSFLGLLHTSCYLEQKEIERIYQTFAKTRPPSELESNPLLKSSKEENGGLDSISFVWRILSSLRGVCSVSASTFTASGTIFGAMLLGTASTLLVYLEAIVENFYIKKQIKHKKEHHHSQSQSSNKLSNNMKLTIIGLNLSITGLTTALISSITKKNSAQTVNNLLPLSLCVLLFFGLFFLRDHNAKLKEDKRSFFLGFGENKTIDVSRISTAVDIVKTIRETLSTIATVSAYTGELPLPLFESLGVLLICLLFFEESLQLFRLKLLQASFAPPDTRNNCCTLPAFLGP